MHTLRVVIVSPADVDEERAEAAKIAASHASSAEPLEIFRWDLNVAPGFGAAPVQIFMVDPQIKIEDSDIVIAIFARRLGTPIVPGGKTGTQHEFSTALSSYRAKGLPHIMAYFKAGKLESDNPGELEQYAALLRFKEAFPPGIYGAYDGLRDFQDKFAKHFPAVLTQVRDKRKRLFTKDKLLEYVDDVEASEYRSLAVPGSELHSSFCPGAPDKPFLRFKVPTTPGYVPNPNYDDRDLASEKEIPHPNEIYLIRDPIRPFEIQIGELRANRYGLEPKEVPFEGVPESGELNRLYPLIQGAEHRWLRIVLAELVNDPSALDRMHETEKEESIRRLIARNPSARDYIKQKHCLFCTPQFQDRRRLRAFGKTIIIANDFPFGPFFHYVVFPTQPVHAWENVTVDHLFEMNWLAFKHLKKSPDQMGGAAGIRMGFNSSIRHLVLGHRTRTSAGASIAHIHKQVWGMASGSVNLAQHLHSICRAYEGENRDYLAEYLAALEKAGLMVWQDENVVLYVPFGQIAWHELQVMVKRKGLRTPLELEEHEVRSLSLAEYIVTRLYAQMEINSFNELVLSLPAAEDSCKAFRIVWTFITREVDLAVSELNLLYVVDQHPYDTRLKIDQIWPSREIKDL